MGPDDVFLVDSTSFRSDVTLTNPDGTVESVRPTNCLLPDVADNMIANVLSANGYPCIRVDMGPMGPLAGSFSTSDVVPWVQFTGSAAFVNQGQPVNAGMLAWNYFSHGWNIATALKFFSQEFPQPAAA